MDMNPVVVEISSDEEDVGLGGSDGGNCYGWISELVMDFDRDFDDSDEVTVIGEVMPKQRNAAVKDDEDDDCVVLDGDPDKQVAVLNDAAGGEDELLVVGEKGQVACRDYPHPRNICASFPFSSTPHERHCDLCHCYVCDSVAPCPYWGSGISSSDHCHATEKEERWKVLRKKLREGKAVLPIPALPKTLPASNLNSLPILSNSALQSQISKPTAVGVCSSINSAIPRINHGKISQSVCSTGRNGCQVRASPHNLPGWKNKYIRRDRGHSSGNLGPRFITGHAVCKRAGPVETALTTLAGYSSSVSVNSVCATSSQFLTKCNQLATPSDATTVNWQDCHTTVSANVGSHQHSSQPNVRDSLGYGIPCQPQVDCQFLPQSTVSPNLYQHWNQPQPVVKANVPVVNSLWSNETGLSNQRLLRDPQLQSAVLPSTVPQYNPEFSELDKFDPLDLELEKWIAGHESISQAPEGIMSPELSEFSAGPASLEPGVSLFDFETF